MKLLIYLVIINIFFADWLAFKLNVIPRWVTWFPEVASLFVLIYVFIVASKKRRLGISLKYPICLVTFVILMVMGFLLNGVSAGVMFSGMRIYLRYIPFFLLPAVWDISDKELFNLLKFILFLSALQLPVVLYQRFIQYSTSLSGDPMGGTLGANTSGVLSVFLLLVLAFYIACYLRERVSFFQFSLGAIVLILPTAMNETKITFALLPVCFILPLLFGGVEKGKIWKILLLFCFAGIAFISLKTIYDFFAVKRWGYGIGEFVQMKGRVEGYADMRLVPIIKTLKMAFDDPVFFFFGIGAGNASGSFTAEMTGAYVKTFNTLGLVPLGVVVLLWEIGFAGIIAITVCLAMVFIDALRLSKSSERAERVIGLAMVSIIPIYCATSAYFNITQVLVINIPFWLLCGFVVKHVYLQKQVQNILE